MLTREKYQTGRIPKTLPPDVQTFLAKELQAIQRNFPRNAVEQTFNTSRIAQGPGFATDTWIAGSELLVPAAGWQFGTLLEWTIIASKTAAGVATPVFAMRGGRTKSTADSLIMTHTGLAQTAAADDGVFTIYASLQDLTTLTGTLEAALVVQHTNAATGFTTGNTGITRGSAAVNVPFFGDQYISLSVNAGALAAWTITQVRAKALW